MTKRWVWAALAMVGCFSRVREVNGPDGKPGWYAIDCSGSQTHCFEAAGDTCPNGYEVADSSGGTRLSMQQNRRTGRVSASESYAGQMLIRCR